MIVFLFNFSFLSFGGDRLRLGLSERRRFGRRCFGVISSAGGPVSIGAGAVAKAIVEVRVVLVFNGRVMGSGSDGVGVIRVVCVGRSGSLAACNRAGRVGENGGNLGRVGREIGVATTA